MARSVSGGPSTVKGASRFLRKWPPATLERRSLCTPPARNQGQAGACLDRTRAIPCKVQQSSPEDRRRARCVPDRTVIPDTSRTPRDKPPPELTCGYEAYGSGAHVSQRRGLTSRVALIDAIRSQ